MHRKVKVEQESLTLTARLHHVIDSRGWLSADLHVHAAPSPDSIVPLTHRVLEFVADGIDMIVSTEHNSVTDYGPAIGQLGLGAFITSARGDELTTSGWGGGSGESPSCIDGIMAAAYSSGVVHMDRDLQGPAGIFQKRPNRSSAERSLLRSPWLRTLDHLRWSCTFCRCYRADPGGGRGGCGGGASPGRSWSS